MRPGQLKGLRAPRAPPARTRNLCGDLCDKVQELPVAAATPCKGQLAGIAIDNRRPASSITRVGPRPLTYLGSFPYCEFVLLSPEIGLLCVSVCERESCNPPWPKRPIGQEQGLSYRPEEQTRATNQGRNDQETHDQPADQERAGKQTSQHASQSNGKGHVKLN